MVGDNFRKSRLWAVLKPFIGIAAAVGLNIFFNRMMGRFHIPLFMDNVGTLLAAALGGYLPGILTGYLTNFINMTADVENVYYASLSVLIATAGAFFYKRGMFDKLWKTILTIPVFAFIGGALGSLLTYCIYGFGMGEGISAPFARALLEKGTLSVFTAQLISDVVIDLIDKTINVLIVFVILKIIPDKVKNPMGLSCWQQRPITQADKVKIDKNKIRGMSLSAKISIVVAFVMIVIAFVTTSISCVFYHSFAIEQFSETGVRTAQLAASVIDGDRVDEYLDQGKDYGGYRDAVMHLKNLLSTTPELEYVYAYRIENDGCHVLFDLGSDGLERSKPGDMIPFDESFAPYLNKLKRGEIIDSIVTDATYGWLLTNYEPVYNSKGKCVCYAATDISMAAIRLHEISFLAKVLSLFVGFFLLILAFCIWLAKYSIIYPIDAMTLVAEEFASDTAGDRARSLKALSDLDIRTGDEVENLYSSMNVMMEESVQQMEHIKEKGEELSKMQNGLITVLADIVESRDKKTGQHIKKTAAYTRFLLQCMMNAGIHADIINPEYIESVANSAPLHDIGKIVVSDTILNKNGRLTDEEFEKMKSHTTAGKEMIQKTMDLVSDPGYLSEAEGLAAYHHEKWDGSGYPNGLSGEEIPLSARVMAVSDVLDALLSKRSYKEPYTFEQAVDIIKEGSGKHFDPTIIRVFLEHLPEIKDIADKQDQEYTITS